MNQFLATSVLLTLCVVGGCGKKNPVTAITVEDSGVQVGEMASEWTADDWNRWRGPSGDGTVGDGMAGDGTVTEQALVTNWDDTTNVLWRADVPGRGHSSPIVVGNQVILATAIDSQEQQLVIAYQRTDGAEQWRTVLHQGGFPSARQVHQKGSNANSTLACDGRRLFIAMLNNDAIVATSLDLNGQVLWQEEIGKFVSRFGYAPSPILYKSLVIFAAENSGGGYLAALDAATGKLAWRTARGNFDSYSSPTVARVGDRDQLLISGDNAVTSYDPANGQELWRTPGTAGSTCGTIVLGNDRILASGGYPEKETVCLSSTGEKLWSNSEAFYEPSLNVVGNYVVGVNDNGIAICWDLESGERLWRERLGGNFSASPIRVGENFYVPNLEGTTFVFRAGDRFELIAENRLGDDAYASPAVSAGQLFLRVGIGKGADRREQLVCIGQRLQEADDAASDASAPADSATERSTE